MDTERHDPIPTVAADGESAVPSSVTDEELFEAYLSARLQQALDALNGARDQLAAEPQDFNRALVVMRKLQELRDAQNALAAQRNRVAAARSAAGLEPVADNPEPVLQASPGPAFRAAQAEQAAKIMAALAARPRTCPSCQALLAADATRCHCGYAAAPGAGLNGAVLLGGTPRSNA